MREGCRDQGLQLPHRGVELCGREPSRHRVPGHPHADHVRTGPGQEAQGNQRPRQHRLLHRLLRVRVRRFLHARQRIHHEARLGASRQEGAGEPPQPRGDPQQPHLRPHLRQLRALRRRRDPALLQEARQGAPRLPGGPQGFRRDQEGAVQRAAPGRPRITSPRSSRSCRRPSTR